jgi:epoxyqueuosine reductase
MRTEQRLEEWARELGFDLFGIAPLRPPRDAAHFEDWLGRGHHAGLSWLEQQRERILDPRKVLPEGRSIVVLGMGHSRPAVEMEGGGRIARYAAGRDYHNLLIKRVRRLLRRMKSEGLVREARTMADAAPLLERSHAAEAGLGFLSKAANLLHPSFGPFFFLAELLVDLDLEPTAGPLAGSCGTCTACMEACPTGAILEPGRVDAGRCISYHTIESSGPIPEAIASEIGPWAFGCDVCSEVCPWTRKAPDLSGRWGTNRVVEGGLVRWLEAPADFEGWTEGTALRRAGAAGLARNAAIALASVQTDASQRALLKALRSHAEPLVRDAAAWSLRRAFSLDQEVQKALDQQRRV